MSLRTQIPTHDLLERSWGPHTANGITASQMVAVATSADPWPWRGIRVGSTAPDLRDMRESTIP